MINRLRIRLTLWFFVLVTIVYFADAVAGFWGLSSRLVTSTEADLLDMCEDMAAAVDYVNGKPTLANWMHVAVSRHIQANTTIQLFGANENLLESYGPKGIEKLGTGRLESDGREKGVSVYSNHLSLPEGYFLQVQLSSQTIDQAISNFIVNKFLHGIPIGIALVIFGWFYSGRAVAPIVKSLATLRSFVDDAGHELNTPVALIENSIETIESYLVEHNLPTDVLRIIQRGSGALKGLSQKLLLLAKMEQPAIAVHFARVSLAELVVDVCNDFSGKAKRKNIDLQVYGLPDVTVLADSDALIEVFNNLIENALNYTPAEGRIFVYGFKADNNVCIAVRDTGYGIPQKSLKHIFDRFYRVDQARSKTVEGTGLGLSIVKAIVEAHNGFVRVESTIDKGSTFFVTLPIMLISKESKLSKRSLTSSN